MCKCSINANTPSMKFILDLQAQEVFVHEICSEWVESLWSQLIFLNHASLLYNIYLGFLCKTTLFSWFWHVRTTNNATAMYHIVSNATTCILNLLLEAYHQPTLYNSWAYQSGGDLMKGVYTCSTEFINRLNPVIHKMFNDKFQQYIFFSLSIFDK